MPNDSTRREVLGCVIMGIGAVGLSPLISGCEDRGSGFVHAPTDPVTQVFRETPTFYKAMGTHLQNGRDVVVTFDGEARIEDEKSPFLTLLREATNREEILAKIQGMDNEAGRQLLRDAFGPELLHHKGIVEPTQVGNDVIEPGTILLIVAIILATAAAAGTVMQAYRGPIIIDLKFGPLSFRVSPVR